MLLALLSLVYPPWAKGATAIYLPLAFFSAALFLSSKESGLLSGFFYLRLVPEKRQLPGLFGWSILALISCGALTLILSAVLLPLGLLDTAPVREKVLSLPIIALISSFTLAPLGEEALFRGFLFRKLSELLSAGVRKKSGFFAALLSSLPGRLFRFEAVSWIFGALLSSAVFALLHFSYGSLAEIIVAFSIGMLLCAFTYKTRSLVPAVLAHAGFNFFSVASGIICSKMWCPF